MCAFFQCFSIFSPLCSYVGQSLFDRIKIVSVTVFFNENRAKSWSPKKNPMQVPRRRGGEEKVFRLSVHLRGLFLFSRHLQKQTYLVTGCNSSDRLAAQGTR